MGSRTQSASYTLLLLLASIATRLLTSVHYIADPDSLRFALGVVDYDVASLQPHFPGYPVFVFIVKLFYWILGSYTVAFALVGGLAVFGLILFSLKFVNARIDSPEGLLLAVLILFNPMIWLMSNRFMPDLLGVTVAIGILALTVRNDRASERSLLVGLVMTGLLAGIRLSYLPLVALAALIAFVRSRHKIRALALVGAGVLVWLVPMILDTGWEALIETATRQTTGHFTEFGGTIDVMPDIEVRRAAVLKGMVADGMGGYWPGRAGITMLVLFGLALFFARGIWWMFHRETDGLLILLLCGIVYITWILMYQNVIYQNRHILPLLPLLLYPVWAGGVQLFRSNTAGRFAAVLFLLAYSIVGIVIATQQMQPTAIAQTAEYLQKTPVQDRIIYSSSLLNYQLHGVGVEGTFLATDDPDSRTAVHRMISSGRPIVVVGWYDPGDDMRPDSVRHFHHNPYVNSVWPEIPLAFYSR